MIIRAVYNLLTYIRKKQTSLEPQNLKEKVYHEYRLSKSFDGQLLLQSRGDTNTLVFLLREKHCNPTVFYSLSLFDLGQQ
ncbi:hypothetical protein [Bacillus siamensis]|uniref:hypothetical protein n=1 Tax=Bacillus siamensis TaxID=659243 RepID=UPI0022B7D478|nr:hypothetical protein [Bacillus siamensis]